MQSCPVPVCSTKAVSVQMAYTTARRGLLFGIGVRFLLWRQCRFLCSDDARFRSLLRGEACKVAFTFNVDVALYDSDLCIWVRLKVVVPK
jgi:hypothetical protein